MPKEIQPYAYQCDCGYLAQFSENSVKDAKARSLGKQQWISEGQGLEKHIVVFQDGIMTTMLCPREGRHDSSAPRFTGTQGRYLAFIQQYTQLHGVAPAEADMQTYFQVSPPSVHQMVLTLERKRLIRRVPGQARSIAVLVPAEDLPALK